MGTLTTYSVTTWELVPCETRQGLGESPRGSGGPTDIWGGPRGLGGCPQEVFWGVRDSPRGSLRRFGGSRRGVLGAPPLTSAAITAARGGRTPRSGSGGVLGEEGRGSQGLRTPKAGIPSNWGFLPGISGTPQALRALRRPRSPSTIPRPSQGSPGRPNPPPGSLRPHRPLRRRFGFPPEPENWRHVTGARRGQ